MESKSSLSNESGVMNDASTDEEFFLGFKRVEEEVRAVPEDGLEPINLDVPTTVTTVLGAWPEILALRAQVAALPNFDIGRFDKLRDYALALAHTHGAYRGLAAPPDGLVRISCSHSQASKVESSNLGSKPRQAIRGAPRTLPTRLRKSAESDSTLGASRRRTFVTSPIQLGSK